MMKTVTATFVIPEWIQQGLNNLAYERYGGVIRDSNTKSIVAMLRETTPNLTKAGTILSQFGSIASILNLGVSVIGFSIVIKHLDEIEYQLKIVHKDINQLNSKFDLAVYTNFRAALDLARDAFTMTKPENRVNMVNLAINGFLEAQHNYIGYFETALQENIQVADEYLKSLFLSYVARARCYLELEEIDTAGRCLQEGAGVLLPRVERFSKSVQISNQQSYEQAQHKMMGTMLAEGLRQTYLPFLPSLYRDEDLSQTVIAIFEQDKRKHAAMEKARFMWETYHRFEAYQTEIQAISKLGISFHDWLKLTPSTEIKPEGAELMYIIPSQPLNL